MTSHSFIMIITSSQRDSTVFFFLLKQEINVTHRDSLTDCTADHPNLLITDTPQCISLESQKIILINCVAFAFNGTLVNYLHSTQ